MKHIFIVNPMSAKGKAVEVAKEISKICMEHKLDYYIITTKGPKDATLIAKEFANDEMTTIYSVGGDGTLTEVVNGMVDGKAFLSVIPAGSGNDFYRTIVDEKEPFYFKKIDVGKINDCYFINNASVGLDAEIASNADKMKQMKIPSSLIYKASIVYTYLSYPKYEITHDLEENMKKQKITLCTVCNGKYYGGGFRIAPKAKFDDGKFDIYIAEDMKKLQIPGLIIKVAKGTHEDSPKVTRYQKQELKITSETPLVCNIDGEIIKENNFHFEVLPNELTLCEGHPKIKQLIREKIIK